jgi:hypothetical protein
MIRYTIIKNNSPGQSAVVDEIKDIPAQSIEVETTAIQDVPVQVEVDGHTETQFEPQEVPVTVYEVDTDYSAEVIDYSNSNVSLISYADIQAAKEA